LFQVLEDSPRDRDLVFLGRLVSDKGADLLLSAAATLSRRGLRPTLTIVGSGPEEAPLREQVRAAGLESTVSFAGARSGLELVRLLNRHRILVAPSRWAEPFGLIALEGIATGCVVVGSNRGGLPDAIGSCGLTFPNGDGDALADALERLLRHPALYASLREPADRHLRRHRCDNVAAEYLRVMARAVETFAPQDRRRGIPNV
jgi:glycogen(starch) synthase